MSALLTTDLLEVWTDPDTAMEAVGTNLGIFDGRVPSPARVLASDERLRNTLFDVLLSLVEGGALEMRPCGGGRHAFRWSEVPALTPPAPFVEPVPEVVVEPAPVVEPVVVAIPLPPVTADVPPVADISAPTPGPGASRPITQAPLLVIPALSCLVAVVCYLWLSTPLAIIVVGVMLVGGVVALVRRVPFAGAWVIGIVAAGLLIRFS